MPKRHQAVCGTRALSRQIVDTLEQAYPEIAAEYPRASLISQANDILQGRSQTSVDTLAELLDQCAAGPHIKDGIDRFFKQRSMLLIPYTKTSSKPFDYHTYTAIGPRDKAVKVIDQALFDRAAKEGFPTDFFSDSYFDHVTIYCIPDDTHCVGSAFRDCTFSVCRLVGVRFEESTLYDTEFHSCAMDKASFCDSTLAYTHFYDCDVRQGGFIRTSVHHSNTIDCALDKVRFHNSTLDNCCFRRVHVRGIRGLHTCTITKSGGTEEECRQNREAIQKPWPQWGFGGPGTPQRRSGRRDEPRQQAPQPPILGPAGHPCPLAGGCPGIQLARRDGSA